jgi:hypothetical protein
MKNLKKLMFLTLLILPLSEKVYATEVFKNFSLGRFDSDYYVNYFKTEENFGSDGAKQSLPSGSSFQIIDVGLQARYVILSDFGVYAGLNVGSSESNDVFATRRNSSLNYAHLGADYLFYKNDRFTLYGDAFYRHAMEKIAVGTDSALNSDGASELQAKLTSIFDFDFIQPYASGGVNYRLEGLSTLLTYELGMQSTFDSVVLGGAVVGYISVVDDSKTSTSYERNNVTSRVNGSSKKFYAINPNSLDSDIYLKYIFNEDFSMKVNGGYTILGSNSALGFHVGVSVAWGFGGMASPRSIPQRTYQPPAIKSNTQPVKKFQEDTNDGVNQDYFREVTPSKDKYIEKVDEPTPEEEEDFKIVPKKSSQPSASDKDYKIKLKKKKRN